MTDWMTDWVNDLYDRMLPTLSDAQVSDLGFLAVNVPGDFVANLIVLGLEQDILTENDRNNAAKAVRTLPSIMFNHVGDQILRDLDRAPVLV